MYSKNSILTAAACFLCTFLVGQINTEERHFIKTHLNQIQNQNTSSVYEEDLLIAQRNDLFIDGEFIELDSIEFQYDINDLLISALTLRWDSSSWNKYQFETFEYDSSENQIYTLTQLYIDGIFINNAQITRVYDTNNNLILYTRDSWIDGAWTPEQKLEYNYDDLNLLTTYIRYRFETDWVPVFKYTYTYNTENLETVELTEAWGGTDWVISRRQETFYNTSNNIIEIDRREWENSEWIPFLRILNDWDENNFLNTQTLYRAPEGEYINWLQYNPNYNENGTVRDQTILEWIDDEWINNQYDTFSYDGRENRIYRLRQNWDIESSTWINARQNFYYYEFVSSTINDQPNNLNIAIIPNPNNGSFTIDTNENIEIAKISIYSNQGQMVFSTDFFNLTDKIHLSNLPSGNYFIKLISKEKTMVKQFIIQH